MKRTHIGLAVAFASMRLLAGEPIDNPVASFYDGPEGYPAWTDAFCWERVFNVTNHGGGTACSGEQNLAAFEAARDAACASGGGVVYFPAGTYDITLPDAGQGAGTGPLSRGLMLRAGTVLRGATPSGDAWARPHAGYATDGQLELPTRLRFARRTRIDEDGTARIVPCDWSFVGLQPEAGLGVKDVRNVGVAWVELDGATVFFGAQHGWSASWNTSTTFLGQKTKNTWPDAMHPWSSRVADGTHPGDSFCGADATYVGAGRGRLVFGVKLTDAVVANDFYWAAGRGADGKVSAFSPYRFCGRIAAYGADIFVANNVLAMGVSNFVYRQWTKNAAGVKATRDVLWDCGNAIGIDINKSLSGIPKPTAPGLGYYGTNVVVRDNWIFSRGNKGVDASGEWAVMQDNFNHRYYLGYTLPPAPYPSPGGAITTLLDGYNLQTPSDGEKAGDYMSRGYDLGGRGLWVDHCEVVNTGSTGNDGEGVMSQRHNNVDVYSWAFTDCRQFAASHGTGTSGETGWMGSYGQNIYGFLLLRNTCDGWVGHAGPGDWRMLDMTLARNVRNAGGAAALSTAHTGVYLPKDCDTSAHTAAVPAPSGLSVAVLDDLRAVRIDWTDNATNEVGFRVERRIDGGEWRVVAYRPAINASKATTGNDAFSTQSISQLNNARWLDGVAPAERMLEYRVCAINAADDSRFVSPISTPIVVATPRRTYAQWIRPYAAGASALPEADPDGDRLDNAAEFLAGTVPTNAASVLRVTSVVPGSLTFDSVTGRTYSVEYRGSLSPPSWQVLTGGVVGTGTALPISDAAVADHTQRFYRVRLTP